MLTCPQPPQMKRNVNLSTATGDYKTSQPNEPEIMVSFSQSTKKVKEVSYKKLQEIYSELIRLSFSQGKAKTLYGAGIHLLDIIKTGGTNFEDKIENTIRRDNATFTRTNRVTFSSLSQNEEYLCPPMPSTKPGSRLQAS